MYINDTLDQVKNFLYYVDYKKYLFIIYGFC